MSFFFHNLINYLCGCFFFSLQYFFYLRSSQNNYFLFVFILEKCSNFSNNKSRKEIGCCSFILFFCLFVLFCLYYFVLLIGWSVFVLEFVCGFQQILFNFVLLHVSLFSYLYEKLVEWKGDYLRFLCRVIGEQNHFPTTKKVVWGV